MKNCLYVVFICLIGLNINQSNAQPLAPVFQWDYATTIPSGANTFMDYTDDVCVGAYSSVPGGSAFLLDNAGNNIVTPEPEDVEWVEPVNIVGRFEGKTYFLSTDLVTHTSTIRVMDNATNNFLYHTITWESFYSWIECHEFDVAVIGSVHKLTFLVDVFDASINRNKAVVKVIDFNILTNSFTEIEEIAYVFSGKNTYAKAMHVNSASNIFIWGNYDKNPAGTNKDMFLARFSPEGDLVFSKSYASYNGRNDNAFDLVADNDGNLFGLSASEDNVAPYSQHIAVLKLNTNNGKAIFIKRIGEGAAGSEAIYSASGNTQGNGLVFAGSASDGASGRNGKIWRLNSSGTTMWSKTINETPPGTVEECRAVTFHPESGMIYTSNPAGGLIRMYCLNTTDGSNIYAPFIYDGPGTTQNLSMDIKFNGLADVIISSVAQVGLNSEFQLVKITEMELRQENVQTKVEISCYPNPATDYLLINGIEEDCLIQIVNNAGQLMLETSINVGNNKIDVQTLPSGQYYVICLTNTGLHQSDFIKIK